MKRFFIAFWAFVGVYALNAQEVSKGEYALPANLAAQPKGQLKSYPVKGLTMSQARKDFVAPPKGYGNVPFYWWNGDLLTKEKLKYQLDIFKDAPIDGLAVSYVHTSAVADKEINKNGYGMYGRTEPGKPAIFTDEWYDIWKWFSGECAKVDIGLGLDDYTFAWQKNGYYPDDIRNLDKMKNYQGQLVVTKDTLSSGEVFNLKNEKNRLSCVAWRLNPTNNSNESYKVGSSWTAPEGEWVVCDVTTTVNHMLEPTHGEELVKRYFQKIEDSMTPEQRKGANYYFQDELHIPLNLMTWSEDFAKQFKKYKGYDVVPYLAAIDGVNIGKMTEKVRLDYFDVLMTLAEERYFKPVFDWHWERGLIYGCDNLSRGLNPTEYVDYFRAMRWFTAPGNDAPARGSSLINCKVSSSISHLYERPRTWLEAFHSMGWSSSGEWLTSQLDHHLIAGGNLLCMHGLYYSTRGSWWEWAPPDFHFRMPYWEHMKIWLEYGERMSYLLSQGTHVCDIALLYPTEAQHGVKGKSSEESFKVGKNLFYAGLDFDYLDYQSVARAKTADKTLNVSNESYKVFVLADIPSMHHSTLEKALAHFRNGGVVVATGELVYATTLEGRSAKVDEMVKEMFGVTAEELKNGKKPVSQTSKAGGKTYYTDVENISEVIKGAITPDFEGGGDAKVLHRKIDGNDLYMVMNVANGEDMFFRSKGKVEMWDATNGSFKAVPVLKQDENGTTLRLDNRYERSYLLMFSEGKPEIGDGRLMAAKKAENSETITGEWKVNQIHTMDNSFGDFRLPVREKMIGAEARTFKVMPLGKGGMSANWYKPNYVDTLWKDIIYGYGTQAEVSFSTDSYADFAQKVKAGNTDWNTYEFSWQYGVWESPGNQGYHGLKGRVDDGFFIMGETGNYAFRTGVYSPAKASYKVVVDATEPTEMLLDGKKVESKVVTLEKGWHEMLLLYKDVKKAQNIYTFHIADARVRSAVVLMPENEVVPAKHDAYSKNLSMRWEECNSRLKYDPSKGENGKYAYRFVAAPGLKELEFSIFAKSLDVWVDGNKIPEENIVNMGEEVIGATICKVMLPEKYDRSSVVAFAVEPVEGYCDATILPYPVRMICGEGLMEPCDWGKVGQMRHYSGGMSYKKHIFIDENMLNENTSLDLGTVTATCEVYVNGVKCGVLLNSPFRVNVAKLLKEGDNEVEVIVYSTLSNNYQTVPTPRHYRGDAVAGMIGPVSVVY